MDIATYFTDFSTSCFATAAGGAGFSAGQIALLVLGILGLTIVLKSTYRRVNKSRRQPRSTARQLYADLQKKSEVKRDVEDVMLELDQLARQIHGRIDTKFAKLEAVIRDADERIDKLSRLTRAAKGSPAVTDVKDGPHAAIYRFADGGLSAPDIAQRVGKTAGEVELILALRKTKREADRTADL